MTSPGNAPQPCPRPTLRDLFGNLRTGLLVVADELKWIALRSLRSLEIRQMEKRLAEEHAALGRAVARAVADAAAGPDGPEAATLDEAARLCLKQIAFLGEEAAYLRAERDRLRQDLLARRRSALTPDDTPQNRQPESSEE
ncbi:MAG: hypothetical protein AB1916_00735 [Thermodesulfobacteriota bacterium]